MGNRPETCKKYYKKNREKILQRAKIFDFSRKGKMYRVLRRVKQRCNWPKSDSYKYYGGRGIKCFLSFKDIEFLWNRDGVDNMEHPSIDRINPDAGYSLSNCRFIERSKNTRRMNFEFYESWVKALPPSSN